MRWHTRVKEMGTQAAGVELRGNPKNPEPVHFFVDFPGGRVEIARTTDDDYWVHVSVNHPDSPRRHRDDGLVNGKLVDARLDDFTKHATQTDVGDFNSPTLEHLAVRVARA